MPIDRLDACGPTLGGTLLAELVATNVVPNVSRSIIRFRVTNNHERATASYWFQIGATRRGPLTVGPGQSLDIDLTSAGFVQTWNTRHACWDGLTVQCRVTGQGR